MSFPSDWRADFQPPQVAIDAMYQAMKDGHNKYTTTAGLPSLRKKIAETWHSRCPGLDESNVCMTMSGTNALLNIFATLVDPGKMFFSQNHISRCMVQMLDCGAVNHDFMSAYLRMNSFPQSIT